jgi:hypothetical protein
MSHISRRIKPLEANFAAEGDLDRARRAALDRAEISDREYPAVREEYIARGEIPPVLSNDGRSYLVSTGVSRCPGDGGSSVTPAPASVTHDNADSRE